MHMIPSMRAIAVDKPSVGDVHETLKGAGLDASTRRVVLHALKNAGQVVGDLPEDRFSANADGKHTRLSPMEASGISADAPRLIRQALSAAARLGYRHEDMSRPIDETALNLAFSKNSDLESRLAAKAALFSLGLIGA